MANWDDVSAPAQSQGGSAWDAVSAPAAAPKLPNVSGAQKMAQDNIDAAKKTSGDSEQPAQSPQSPEQHLDTAMGMPISSTLRGANQNTPLPSAIRSQLTDAYANGSATHAGDFMQSILHGVMPVIAGSIQRAMHPVDYANKVVEGAESMVKGGASLMAYPFLSQENRQELLENGTFPPLSDYKDVEKPTGTEQVRRGIELEQATLGKGMGALYYPAASVAGPVLNPIIQSTGGKQPEPGEVPTARSLIPGAIGVGMDVLGIAGVAHGASELSAARQARAAGPQFPSGAGPWDTVHGADLMKETVGSIIKKPANEVTSQDVDNLIGSNFQNTAPAAKDFHDVSAVSGIDVDALHNIYKETGVRPDQVFEDSRRDPSMLEDIGAGKIPAAYSHLIDTRPEISTDVKASMDKMSAEGDAPAQGARSSEGASKDTVLSAVADIFNPAGKTEASSDMATALRQGRGPIAQTVAQIQDGLSGFAKTFSGMADDARLKFIDYLENRSQGAKLENPELQGAADKIKDVYQQMSQEILKVFPDARMRQDYFTHQYKDRVAAEKFFNEWIAKQGSERNLRARAFPTLKEAMEAGLEPKSTNPLETVMGYVSNMGNLLAAHKSLNLAMEGGIADYFAKGEQPEGWVPLAGNLSEQAGKLLYAPEDAARVYNNDISEGFTGPFGKIADVAQRVNNFGNMVVLALSAYHATVTTMSSMAKDVGRALTMGTAADRASSLASAATAPVTNVIKGGKLKSAYLGKADLSPDAQRAMDALVRNNAINIKQQDYWKSGPAKTYVDVFLHGAVKEEIGKALSTMEEHPATGPVRILANEVGRVMNTISAPLFDHYIPRIKLAASFEEMHGWMKGHPDATPDQIDKAAQDIGNNSDNAFGEMMRDNLFWHKITRQTLQTQFLSYSWITGAARMLKGIPDIGMTLMGKQELTSNARYLIGMAATYAVVNGARTYFGTRHAPDEFMDFIYPRTGGSNPDGSEERVILPSHIGQFTNYLHDGIGELGNEASPTLKLLYHLLGNSDFRDFPLTNEENPWFSKQRWEDYSDYVFGVDDGERYAPGEFLPMGAKTMMEGNKKGSKLTGLERFMGERQAPRFITDPEGYKKMMENVHNAAWRNKLRSDQRLKNQYEDDEE